MIPDDDVLQLLLARAGAPALPDGLPLASAVPPDRVETLPGVETRGSDDIPPNGGDGPEDLPVPIWGVIAPEGPAGDRLLGLCDRLIKHREARQGRAAPRYRVPPHQGPMSLTEALAWRTERFDSGADLARERADLQLILGDLDQVPLAIQKVQQGMGGKVGRLCFSDERGYEAYIDKVLRAEGAPRRGYGRVVMHTAHDGSKALDLGRAGLAVPGAELLRADLAAGKLKASGMVVYDTLQEPARGVLLDNASGAQPGVLFTLSHGLGMPLAGTWASPAQQRAEQGSMAFGFDQPLTAEDVASVSFMPDGLWLMFACYGAGTPDASVYSHWLSRLAAPGAATPDLRRTLAQDRPFIAALPQQALANPRGPLAFIGHVDLAWTHCFRDGDQSRAGRFMRVLDAALAGLPMGEALLRLSEFVREAETALNNLDAHDVPAAAPDAAGLAALERQRSLLWMRRQDLDGFILLGDPAVTLPVGAPDSLADTAAGATAAPAPAGDALERAVLQALLGDQAIDPIAAALGMDRARLEHLAAQYRQAGRRALGIDR
jgi:hypothetical protein